MRQRIDDALRLLGLAQGATWLISLGGATIAAGIVSGVLTAYLALPWWSVALVTAGAFVLVAGIIRLIADSRRSSPTAAHVAITGAIEDAGKLRLRLVEASDEATEDEQKAWTIRVNDWMQAAEAVVAEHAPGRLSAYMIDTLVAAYPLKGIPRWKVDLLMNIDIQVDRLMVLRVSP